MAPTVTLMGSLLLAVKKALVGRGIDRQKRRCHIPELPGLSDATLSATAAREAKTENLRKATSSSKTGEHCEFVVVDVEFLRFMKPSPLDSGVRVTPVTSHLTFHHHVHHPQAGYRRCPSSSSISSLNILTKTIGSPGVAYTRLLFDHRRTKGCVGLNSWQRT